MTWYNDVRWIEHCTINKDFVTRLINYEVETQDGIKTHLLQVCNAYGHLCCLFIYKLAHGT
jgi:hypothetical protein